MRVLLVSANTERINMPALPLGLACVAAAVRDAGHEVRMVDLQGGDMGGLIREAVDGFAPEAIGVSVRNIDDQVMHGGRFLLEPAREAITSIRGLSAAPIVLGGAGYSIFPQSALAYLGADIGIRGAGEGAFPELLRRLAEGEGLHGIEGLHLPGGEPSGGAVSGAGLGGFPMPDSSLWTPPALEGQEVWMPAQSRRGCPMGCTYCSTADIEGRVIRMRPPEAVAAWMGHWAGAGFNNFFFVDNTFNLPPSYAKALCRAIIALKNPAIRWRCIIYPYKVDDELAALMREAGCVQASFGFESGSQQVLRLMNKRYSPGGVRRASETLKRRGIQLMGFLLLGGPGETMQSAAESLGFADSLGLDAVKVTTGIRIYPRTGLARIAVEEGMINAGDGLLMPRFYLARGLEETRLTETVGAFMKDRSNWMT